MTSSRLNIRRALTWLWHWLPPVIVMATIFYASAQTSLPQAKGEWLDALMKKLAHIGEYTVLFLLLARAWAYSVRLPSSLWAAWLSTAAYAISDEVHQSFVPNRHANWYDIVIDVALPLLLSVLYGFASRRGGSCQRLRHGKHQDLPK